MDNPADNLAVSVVHEICPTCGEKHDLIIMNSRLTKKYKKQVEELNHKVIGISDQVCNKCKETYVDKGYVCLLEVDPTKSDFKHKETIYFTRRNAWIKKDVLEEIIKEVSKFIIEDSYVFMDIDSYTQIINIPTE